MQSLFDKAFSSILSAHKLAVAKAEMHLLHVFSTLHHHGIFFFFSG